MKSVKEKLDEKLGIKSVDELFNSDDIDEILKDSNIEIQKIDKEVAVIEKKITNESTELQTNPTNTLSIYNMENSLSELSFLIEKSKAIIGNLYNYISSQDFADPDLISATAKMIESSRIVIADYIELYKDKMRMIHEYNLENLKHKNRMELEERKMELKKQLLGNKDIDNTDMVSYTQEDIIKIIADDAKKV